MKKVYIARRIPKQPNPAFILNFKKGMKPEEVHNIYVKRTHVKNDYIYNGPWILRPPLSEDVFSLNNMPPDLTPAHIWDMVKEKIESSDVFVSIVNQKSYGTIAETGYACKCPNLAVYVIPEFGVTSNELQDLWFVFQMAKSTQYLWDDKDIRSIEEFSYLGINSVEQYKAYVSSIVPNFMKK